MTNAQARALQPGDRVKLNLQNSPETAGIEFHVTRVHLYAGPMGSDGPAVVEIADDHGREGTVQGEAIEILERLPGAEPSWWADLMGEEGVPRD